MTDQSDPPKTIIETAPPPFWSRLSIIWIVPLIALLVTVGVAWKTYADRGELIEIDFSDATGITAGETPLKFRDVKVGTVEKLAFSEDLSYVRVFVRVETDVSRYIDDKARFWLVQPEVSVQGISRLETVLSGIFIEGWWDTQPGPAQTVFKGMERPPVAPDPNSGTVVELVAENANGLAEGAPILYRGLTVGRLQNLRLDDKSNGVVVDAFVKKPFDAHLSTLTRFWNVSGAQVSIGTSGIRLGVASLASLVQGGVEFDTFSTGGEVVDNGRRFRLYANADDAKDSIFDSDVVEPPQYVMLFDQAINGLRIGSKVQYRGVEAGAVTSLSIKINTDADGKRYAQQQVIVALSPERLGLQHGAEEAQTTEFLEHEVAEGLRARVMSTGLLGTTRIIALDNVEDAAPATIDADNKPWPSIPTAPAAENDVAMTARDVMQRINNLPIEDLMQSAIRTFDSISAVADSQETREIPRNLSAALEQLQVMISEMNTQGMADKAVSAMGNISSAASSFMNATSNLGQTLDSTNSAAQAVAAMPFGQIGTNVDGLISDIRAMLGTEDAEKLPKALADTLNQTALMLEELRQGGAADKINDTLVATQDAATAIAQATNQMPQMVQRLDQLIVQAQGLVTSYGQRSAFNDQLVQTLTELRRAAGSFGELARTLQRNPQSIILGR